MGQRWRKETLSYPEDLAQGTSSPPFPWDLQSQGGGSASPNALDHEVLLLGTHLHNEQRADLAEALEQAHGIHHGGWRDGVCPGQGAQQLPEPIVLTVQEAEHGPDQLGALHKVLLGPTHHCVRHQLLQRL